MLQCGRGGERCKKREKANEGVMEERGAPFGAVEGGQEQCIIHTEAEVPNRGGEDLACNICKF